MVQNPQADQKGHILRINPCHYLFIVCTKMRNSVASLFIVCDGQKFAGGIPKWTSVDHSKELYGRKKNLSKKGEFYRPTDVRCQSLHESIRVWFLNIPSGFSSNEKNSYKSDCSKKKTYKTAKFGFYNVRCRRRRITCGVWWFCGRNINCFHITYIKTKNV